MSKPRRIQRKRTAGWRMPEGAVYVGRPTLFDNPYREGDQVKSLAMPWVLDAVRRIGIKLRQPLTRVQAVELFRARMQANAESVVGKYMLEQLRGHDLACWCRLDQPCHADVLLELANGESRP